jgi:hypothetical protein
MSNTHRPDRRSSVHRKKRPALPRPAVPKALPLDSSSCPYWHFAIIALLPAWLWLLNGNWCFLNIGNMDPWYYFGQFRHYPQFQLLSPSYPGERLIWILSGAGLGRIFGHINGVIALHVSVYLGTLFLVHYILRHIAGSATALAGTLLLGSYPCFIGSNGWDYVESLSILLFSASLALLVQARIKGGSPLALLFSGVCWFGLIYSFLAWAAFTPFYFALAVRFADRWKYFWRRVFFTAGLLLTAGLITTAALSAVYRMLGVPGFFYSVTIRTALHQYSISNNPWIGADWYRQCTWLIFPCLAFGAAALWIVRTLRNGTSLADGDLPWLGLYASCFLMMVLLTINKNRLLGFDYTASILIPTAFLTLALTVVRVPPSLPRPAVYLVMGLSVVISTAPLRIPLLLQYFTHWQFIFASSAILLAYAFRMPLGRRSVAGWSGAMLLFAVVSSCLVSGYTSQAWHSEYNGRDISSRVSKAMDIVLGRLPQGQYPIFWFDNFTDPLSGEFRGVMCAFLAPSRSMDHFPSVNPKWKYTPGNRIFLLNHDGQPAGPADLLRSAGIEVAPLSRDIVSEGGVSYWITQFEVLPPRPSATRDRARL